MEVQSGVSGDGFANQSEVVLPKMTVDELREFDGKGKTGKIYVALNGKVYDVTEKGAQFYMPGCPYEMFAGRDATLALATMSTVLSKDEDNSCADVTFLTESQKSSLERWEKQFTGKYNVVAKLIK